MDIKILPGQLAGSVQAIASKSAAHRLMICAALGEGASTLRMENPSEDMMATAEGLKALGAHVEWTKEGLCSILPIRQKEEKREGDGWKEQDSAIPLVDCKESGSTLRFLLPVAASLYEQVAFTGKGRLGERPLQELTAEMEQHGCTFSNPSLPFTIHGKMKGGEFHLPGNVSSQYITGLLLAAPLLEEGVGIRLTSPLESAPYVEMTLHAMKTFGVEVGTEANRWEVFPGQKYRRLSEYPVEGDWSNAAFWLCSGALGSHVLLKGLDKNSSQGDKEILSLLEAAGAKIFWQENGVQVKHSSLQGTQVDLRSVPDLLPILAVVAAFAKGKTRFYNGARLRLKESDRIAAVKSLILSLGGYAEEQGDQLTVFGTGLTGGKANSFGDHRIAMAAAIAGLSAKEGVVIQGAEAVNKSYPGFWEDFQKLGGKMEKQ